MQRRVIVDELSIVTHHEQLCNVVFLANCIGKHCKPFLSPGLVV